MRATTKEERFQRAVRRATEWVMEDLENRTMNARVGRTHDWMVQISETKENVEGYKVAMLYYGLCPYTFTSENEIFISEDMSVGDWLDKETIRENREKIERLQKEIKELEEE